MAESWYELQVRYSRNGKWYADEGAKYPTLEAAKKELAWWQERFPEHEHRIVKAYVQVRYKAVKV